MTSHPFMSSTFRQTLTHLEYDMHLGPDSNKGAMELAMREHLKRKGERGNGRTKVSHGHTG